MMGSDFALPLLLGKENPLISADRKAGVLGLAKPPVICSDDLKIRCRAIRLHLMTEL